MDTNERDRLAAALAALRPDWESGGFDRLRSLRKFITDNLMTMAYRDAALQLVAIAVDPKTETPGRVLHDGPWRQLTRTIDRTTLPPAYVPRGRECVCGVREDVHDRSAAVLDHHPFTPPGSLR